MKIDVFNMSNTPNASSATITTKEYEYKVASQNKEIMRQLKVKSKKNWLKSARVLKATSKNTGKPLRVQQKMWVTKASKIVEAAMK